MKLKELSERTEVSRATVKYWIREGLLPPGRLRNTTTADYDESHVERLTLISAMRLHLGHSIEVIRTLTTLLDDPEVPVVSIMDHCQSLAIGLASPSAPTTPAEPPGDEDGSAAPVERSIDQRVASLCEQLGWPDVESGARTALRRVMAQMEPYGMAPSTDSLIAYGRALAPLAESDLTDQRVHGSRDAIALGVLIGVTMQTRYLVAMNSLAHASVSIQSYLPDGISTRPREAGSSGPAGS